MADKEPEGHNDGQKDRQGSTSQVAPEEHERSTRDSIPRRALRLETGDLDFGSPRRANTNPAPSRESQRSPRHDVASPFRSRGATISARPPDFDDAVRPGRFPSLRESLREGSPASALPRSMNLEHANSRDRRSTITGRPRGNTIFRRPSLALASGVPPPPDAQSMNFSLGGPQDSPANQPYVQPGYSDLNPAYDQPTNVRPVWGLAKPLPRVIRRGMVPTLSELRHDNVVSKDQAKQEVAPDDNDLEKGRVEPTLKLGKISSQLQDARQLQENRLLERYGDELTTKISNEPRPLTPHLEAPEEAVEDGGDLGLGKPSQDLPPLTQAPTVHEAAPQPHELLDDTASTIHEDIKDDDWLADQLIRLKAHGAEDEVHNHHTHWSVIRTRFREPLAEFVAVVVQLTLGFCADLAVTTSGGKTGNEATTDWAWGLATMCGIYIAGGISGAHLNPAISIMLWVYRGFPLRKVPSYVFAQILGAFVAGLIAYGLHRNNIIEFGGVDLGAGGTMGDFITYPRYTWIDVPTAFFTEFTGTAFLAIIVLALGDDTNAPPGAGMNAFILGLVITILSMAFGYNTGAALNPSRDLGPRLALLAVGYGGEVFRNGWWVYGPWVATITGAIFGAGVYDVAIFVGGESPINYSRRRIKRAGHKWKKRTAARSRRVKRKVGLTEDEKL